jgi:hypothetical protein
MELSDLGLSAAAASEAVLRPKYERLIQVFHITGTDTSRNFIFPAAGSRHNILLDRCVSARVPIYIGHVSVGISI